MQVLEYQMLDARNLLCCSTKFDPDGITRALLEINELLGNNNISRNDTTIYLSFNNKEDLTINIYLSLKKKITDIKDTFWLKERIFLIQAVRTRHEGELYTLRDSFFKILQYLDTHQLSPITPFCCKVLAGLENPEDIRDMIVDIYVGINGNIV